LKDNEHRLQAGACSIFRLQRYNIPIAVHECFADYFLIILLLLHVAAVLTSSRLLALGIVDASITLHSLLQRCSAAVPK
jgi:cytochrome b